MYEVSDLHMATIMNGGIWATANARDCIEDKDIKIQIQPKDIKVMQFTGLQDINGTDIYEGDIVECLIEGERFGAIETVEFKNGCFWLRHRDVSLSYWVTHTSFDGDFKVIGNIYQHPHLLK